MLDDNENGLHYKAFNFDLDKKALIEAGFLMDSPIISERLKPYRLIAKEMKKFGISHRQYSGYRSNSPIDEAIAANIAKQLGTNLPWLEKCIQRFDVTNIGEQYSVQEVIEQAAAESKSNDRFDRALENKPESQKPPTASQGGGAGEAADNGQPRDQSSPPGFRPSEGIDGPGSWSIGIIGIDDIEEM
jgi:virulence-associated protein VapD